jgi:hypothetical protein
MPSDTQDKLELSTAYPTFFLINAIGFMGTFFLARIVYGGYNVRTRAW